MIFHLQRLTAGMSFKKPMNPQKMLRTLSHNLNSDDLVIESFILLLNIYIASVYIPTMHEGFNFLKIVYSPLQTASEFGVFASFSDFMWFANATAVSAVRQYAHVWYEMAIET